MLKRVRWLPVLILLSLNGCADLFFSDFDLHGLKGLPEAFNGLRGVGELFNTPERAQRLQKEDKASPVRCATSIHTSKKALCLASQPETDKHWWFNDVNGEKQPLQAPENLAESIDTFEVDRDWQYIAIVSAEEGHPMLAVYDLQTWINTGEQPSAIYTLNPYPGTVHMIGWANNQMLHALSYGQNGLRFESDGPVSAEDAATGDWPLKEMRDFRLDRYTMKIIHLPAPEGQGNAVKNDKREEKR